MKSFGLNWQGFPLIFLVFTGAHSLAYSAVNDGGKYDESSEQAFFWREGLQKENDVFEHQKVDDSQQIKANLLDNQNLQQQPQLMRSLLMQALNGQDAELVASLLEGYRSVENADRVLVLRAEAFIARSNGQQREALEKYQELLAQKPQDARNRLDYAAALFEDNQRYDAAKEFETVSQQEGLPQAVYQNIKYFQTALKQQSDWDFNIGLSPVYSRNVNDVAPKHCVAGRYCSLAEEENAVGVAYEFHASKRTPLKGHHNILFRSNFSGSNYYFSNKSQYDFASGRAYLGWQWQDKRQELSVLPFYQMQFGGSDYFVHKDEKTKRVAPYLFSRATGAQLNYSRTYGSRLQSHHSLERYHVHYLEQARAERSNGKMNNMYHALAYRLTPRSTVFGSWQFSKFVPNHRVSDGMVNNQAYLRNAFGLGWIQNWRVGKGLLNSRITASLAKRKYRGLAAFSTESQHNIERSWSLNLSHSKVQWKGIKPTLNYRYDKVSSNQLWAQRNRQEWFIGLEKDF